MAIRPRRRRPVPLAAFGNAAMKKFVQDCAHFNWSPSTLADHVLIVKLIIASAVNEEGDPLDPCTWNRRFLNAPAVETAKQKRFVFTRDQIEALLREQNLHRKDFATPLAQEPACGSVKCVRSACAATIPKHPWEPGKILVRTTMFNNDETGRTKTESGKRTVYLHSSLDQMIASFAKKGASNLVRFCFKESTANR